MKSIPKHHAKKNKISEVKNLTKSTNIDKMKIMKTIINSFVFTVIAAFIALPVAAEERVNDADRTFYSHLSSKASALAIEALVEELEDAGVSQLTSNKVIVEELQENGLSPNGPRWTCCEACVENDQPNDSAACQCCDGLGDAIKPLWEMEK